MKFNMKEDITKNLWALCVIVLGIILLGNYLTLWNVTLFFKGWWTLFFIVPSVISLFSKNSLSDKLTTGVILVGAFLFLAKEQTWLNANVDIWMAILALVVVRIGIGMMLKKREFDSNIEESVKNSKMDRNVGLFGGGKSNYANQEYNGGSVTGIFGGADLNLKNAKITRDIYIDATAIFGEVDIIVPANVNIKVNSTNIFGGTDNHCKVQDAEYTIYINSTAIFGGVDIK